MAWFLLGTHSLAAAGEFETEPYSAEEKERIVAEPGISIVENEPAYAFLKSFDVSPSGRILVEYWRDLEEDSTVFGIYSSGGSFEKGISVVSAGEVSACWQGENLSVYVTRAARVFTIGTDLGIIDVAKVPSTAENSSIFYTQYHDLTKKTGTDTVYELVNDDSSSSLMGVLGAFNCLIRRDENGTTVLLRGTEHVEERTGRAQQAVTLFVITIAMAGLILIKGPMGVGIFFIIWSAVRKRRGRASER